MKWIRKLKEMLKKRKEERPIVLDTCALQTKQAMEIIEKAPKVILLTCILDEMDKYKKEANVCEVLRKSREDKNSEKYVCVAGYDKHLYNDKNIIDYCRRHRRSIIVTRDNNVCNYAKAYKIDYIFVEDVKKNSTKIEHAKSSKKEKVIRQNVKGVIYKGEKLYLTQNKKNISFLVYRNGKNIESNSNKQIELEVGDFIYMLKKDENEISLTQYEMLRISQHNYAKPKYSDLIQLPEVSSEKLKNLPKEVKNQIFTYLNPEAKTVKPETVETNLKENKEIHFYNKWIGVNRYKDYHTEVKVERKGKLIKIQDYQNGDYLYILRYNISNRYVQITVYEIVLENNQYKVRDIEEQRVYYVNEIYMLDFSEELKDAIWQFFISNIGN